MTATADRYAAGRSREELRLVELASGLLILLDAYRITGQLPLLLAMVAFTVGGLYLLFAA